MIEKNVYRITCDVKGCNKIAGYSFASKGRSFKFFICSDCLKKLTDDAKGIFTPKSPENAIKKAMNKETVKENK